MGQFGGVRYSITGLLKIVTAFTAGHSITLLAGALGWLKLPGQPVEILIAVSILVSAIHAIRPVFPGKESLIAAGFGLIHGLAFSAVLSKLQLHAGKLALSVLGFNLGIEIVQLFVIAMIIPSLILLSKTILYPVFRSAGAFLSAVAALGWIVQRSTGNANLISDFADKVKQYDGWCVGALAVAAVVVYATTAFADKNARIST